MTALPDPASSAPEKMLRILDCFTLKGGQLSVSEIAELTGMARSTAHRWVAILRDAGLLDQDYNRDAYRLGLRLIHLGNVALNSMDVSREARPVVEALGRAGGEMVRLYIFDGNQMIFVTRASGGRAGRFNATTVTETSPCYCSSVGKAVLAFQPDDVVERIIAQGLHPYTKNTLTDPDALREDLRRTRERGYSINNGEMDPGERCIGAPVRNPSGRIIAGLSLSSTPRRLTDERIPELAELVMRHAELLSIQLGHRPNLARHRADPAKRQKA
ncbi:IclR family transcriptional regulator [Cereibacter johrii]|uniref:IclR family transcriptional regulator n=1 Tax=Cereibacter johrii TaxID=445629 RepID=UPI000DCB0558|nr:IclR family transcriptional regulator [Cereibacter johrii]QCP87808.1 IclR family transcriptional regulator [Cereibacter sphaeroides]RAZ87146.1 IclR family transcriptional regulator [Cereibacter johrii]RDS96748.1 IclR family transcriptional regulator [Cereibacter sphaeroides f. sp. denitrificans]